MVAALHQGASQRAVARQFGVSLLTVQRWAQRAGDAPLDAVDWRDRPSGPRHAPARTVPEIEARVLQVRQVLRQESDLGEYGAQAIRRVLQAEGVAPLPAASTIYRIMERHGALDVRRRVRRRPPRHGWYLPEVAAGRAELDAFDFVEDLRIQGGPLVEVHNGVSLRGGLVASWPRTGFRARDVVACLVEHWRAVGLPSYAQFDNETRFQGPHQHPGAIGVVIRLCLSLGVVPVFAGGGTGLPGEHRELQRAVAGQGLGTVPPRVAGRPAGALTGLHRRPAARSSLRRTNAHGHITLLGQEFAVADTWVHRLVRCEFSLDAGELRYYGLRRREP